MARSRIPGKIEDEKLRNSSPTKNFVVSTIYHILAWALAIGGAIFLYWLYRAIRRVWE